MNKLFLFSLSFALGIGTTVTEILVTLSPYIAQKIGASQESLGTSFSVYFGALAISTLILSFVPIKATMRQMLLLGVAGFFVSLLGMVVAHSLVVLYLCRFIQGLSAGLLQTLAVSIVKQADKNPSAHRALAMQSVISETIGLPMPIISGLLVSLALWQMPFVILAVVSVVTWASFRKEKSILLDAQYHAEDAHHLGFLKRQEFIRPAMLGGISNSLAWAVITLLSFVIQNHYHLSAFEFGIIQTGYLLLYILGSYLAGKTADSWVSLRFGNIVLVIGIGLAILFKFTQLMPLLTFVGAYVYFVGGYFYPPCMDLSQNAGSKTAVPKITATYMVVRLALSALLTWAFSFLQGGTALFDNVLIAAFVVPLLLSVWTLRLRYAKSA